MNYIRNERIKTQKYVHGCKNGRIKFMVVMCICTLKKNIECMLCPRLGHGVWDSIFFFVPPDQVDPQLILAPKIYRGPPKYFM